MNCADKLKFRVLFSQEWVDENRRDNSSPVDWLAKELKSFCNAEITYSSQTECKGLVDSSRYETITKFKKLVGTLICSEYKVPPKHRVFEVVQDENEEETLPQEETPAEAEADFDDDGEDDCCLRQKTAFEKIMSLNGAKEFKDLACECADIAQRLVDNNSTEAFTSRSYLISVSEGYGLTTYLNLFSELIEELNLLHPAREKRVAEITLEAPAELKSLEKGLESAVELFEERGGRVICIDISEWMTCLKDKKFLDFLKLIDKFSATNIIFFRVPFLEKNYIKDMKNDLNDVLFVKTIAIPPFNIEELRSCADQLIRRKNFSMGEDAWEIFDLRVVQEKSDGRFYGINTVRKIVNELLYIKQLHDVKNGKCSFRIRKEEIEALVEKGALGVENASDKLRDMVGMQAIYDKVSEIVRQIEFQIKKRSFARTGMHMMFTGNPGTGKTTVARMVGSILKEKGILRNGYFFEYQGRALCGRFVGETAPKTAAICRDAYGSVLFIDEAYALFREGSEHSPDYGREVIDTLIAEMENHRDDLVVIMAGYTDDMKRLMKANLGLEGRFSYIIDFPNYTRDQLADIFIKMAENEFENKVPDDLSEAVSQYFSSLEDRRVSAPDFSNARFVRNLYERMWAKAAMRCQIDRINFDEPTVDDFELAIKDREFRIEKSEPSRKIGF